MRTAARRATSVPTLAGESGVSGGSAELSRWDPSRRHRRNPHVVGLPHRQPCLETEEAGPAELSRLQHRDRAPVLLQRRAATQSPPGAGRLPRHGSSGRRPRWWAAPRRRWRRGRLAGQDAPVAGGADAGPPDSCRCGARERRAQRGGRAVPLLSRVRAGRDGSARIPRALRRRHRRQSPRIERGANLRCRLPRSNRHARVSATFSNVRPTCSTNGRAPAASSRPTAICGPSTSASSPTRRSSTAWNSRATFASSIRPTSSRSSHSNASDSVHRGSRSASSPPMPSLPETTRLPRSCISISPIAHACGRRSRSGI